MPDTNENFVFKILSTLDVSKSTGLVSSGPRLLKILSPVTTNSITFIAQKCILQRDIFLAVGKTLTVNPLYKGGAKDEIIRLSSYFHIAHTIKTA